MIEAALPRVMCAPVEAMHAAPISAKESTREGFFERVSIISFMVRAIIFPIMADGIPVLGGAGEIGVPFVLFCGLEIACGGANAIPIANMFE